MTEHEEEYYREADAEARAGEREQKPTPGPWQLEHDSDTLDPDYGPDVSWPWRILDQSGAVVVDFTGGREVSEADARLIAAAPDLLAACAFAWERLDCMAGTLANLGAEGTLGAFYDQ